MYSWRLQRMISSDMHRFRRHSIGRTIRYTIARDSHYNRNHYWCMCYQKHNSKTRHLSFSRCWKLSLQPMTTDSRHLVSFLSSRQIPAVIGYGALIFKSQLTAPNFDPKENDKYRQEIQSQKLRTTLNRCTFQLIEVHPWETHWTSQFLFHNT